MSEPNEIPCGTVADEVLGLRHRIATLEARLARVLGSVHEGQAHRRPWPGVWSRRRASRGGKGAGR